MFSMFHDDDTVCTCIVSGVISIIIVGLHVSSSAYLYIFQKYAKYISALYYLIGL